MEEYEKDDRFFDRRHFTLNKRFLTHIGHWPYQAMPQRLMRLGVLYVIYITILIPGIIKVKEYGSDVDGIIQCVVPITALIGATIKMIPLYSSMGKIRKILRHIRFDWEHIYSAEDEVVFENSGRNNRRITILYACYIYTSMMMYILAPLSPVALDLLSPLNETRKKKFLYELQYHIDEEKYFYHIFMHTFVATVAAIMVYVTVDTMYMMFAEHACGVFTVVGTRLQRLGHSRNLNRNHTAGDGYTKGKRQEEEEEAEAPETGADEEQTRQDLVLCIKIHQRAIEFVNLVESTFLVSLFIQVTMNVICLSFTGVQTIRNLDNSDDVVRFGSFTLAQIIHLYCLSIPGQRILDYTGKIFRNACESRWHLCSMKTQRMIMFVLARSTRPCAFTAGNLCVMGHETFLSVIQTAMSYFTVLSSTQ